MKPYHIRWQLVLFYLFQKKKIVITHTTREDIKYKKCKNAILCCAYQMQIRSEKKNILLTCNYNESNLTSTFL